MAMTNAIQRHLSPHCRDDAWPRQAQTNNKKLFKHAFQLTAVRRIRDDHELQSSLSVIS
jgi:hypothetical protein